jgi:uncharacterized membrane protein
MNPIRLLDFAVPSKRAARKLSTDLRGSGDRSLRRRRTAMALTMTSAASMGVISLYQLGVLQHLPELPLPGFNSEKVNSSSEAYSHFSMPDGALGLASYAATAALIAAGPIKRSKRYPWIPVAAAAKVSLDAALAVKLTVDEVRKQKAVCSWCLLASGATFLTLKFVWPEALSAIRQLRSSK